MPKAALIDAFTLQDEEERVIFVLPWLDGRFLIVGTTDMPHAGDPGRPRCSPEETAYLLAAYNRYFARPTGPATEADIVHSWSGVRALHDEEGARPSRISRSPALSFVANGTGGFVTLYGGKLTTHRALAEEVIETLIRLGAEAAAPWTKDVPIHGGSLSRPALLSLAASGPAEISEATRGRWALSYGDQIETLYGRIAAKQASADEIVPGIPRAELEYAVEVEDAMTAEDFLLRRSKLHLMLDQAGRHAVARWFETAA
jgi:glycerol-3-phosphate dehydrogenase